MPNEKAKQAKEYKADEHKDGYEKEAKLELVELMFRTPDDRMPELTNIPLNQVLPLSMVMVNEQGIKMLADRLAGKDGVYDEDGKPILLSEIFRKAYHQYRRSVRGEHKMALATLTQEELAGKIEEEPGEYEDT